MRTLTLLVALATILAGCSDASPATVDDDTFEDIDVEVTEDTGLIRGVVVDETINPVEGARVILQGQDAETVSDPEGRFVFTDLAPGSYFVKVSRIGYGTVSSSVVVEAGIEKPPIVRVMLPIDLENLPTAETLKFQGHIQCTLTAVWVTFAACGVTDERFITFIDVDGYPDHIQAEMTWRSTQMAGDGLQLWVFDGTTSAPMKAVGTDPLVISQPRDFWENGTGGAKEGRTAYAEEGSVLAFRAFADGVDGSNQCATIPLCVGGVGGAVEQPFEIYTTLFNRMAPDEGWMFVTDGAHPIPS